MNVWQLGECGYVHEWGLCSGEHQVMDSEDFSEVTFPNGNPLRPKRPPLTGSPTRQIVLGLLRTHALSSMFSDGNVICACGYVGSLVWFTEHVMTKVSEAIE